MSSEHSPGAMNQLADALDLAGFTPTYVTKLKQYKSLAGIKLLLDGMAEIVQINHIIDCDTNPFIPDGWKVEEHRKGGQLEWGTKKGSLYLSELQKKGKHIEGNKLRKKLENMPCYNANVLDYLLAHTELILEEWKGKAIFFWGTIYRDSDGHLYVRCLYGVGDRWGCYCSWLGSDFSANDPAALRAS